MMRAECEPQCDTYPGRIEPDYVTNNVTNNVTDSVTTSLIGSLTDPLMEPVALNAHGQTGDGTVTCEMAATLLHTIKRAVV